MDQPWDDPVSDWDPDLYTRYEDERTRPASDLLARVPLDSAASIIDLGCGPGNSTSLLIDRFPSAALLGIDSSRAMVEAAKKRLPAARFEVADIATWTPAGPVDLLFANAVLQWLPDHAGLLPRLLQWLRPGGVLAVQMPDNLDEASHRAMRTVAAKPAWRSRLNSARAERIALAPMAEFYDVLSRQGASVDVWRTVYNHALASPAAIVAWVRATGLRPFLDRLQPDEADLFLAAYEAELGRGYPARADGKRLLAFPRLFIVARRTP